MHGSALVVNAIHIVLRRLGELPENDETRELRDRGLDYINEAVVWTSNGEPPSVETRETLMKKVLALYVTVNRLGRRAAPTVPPPERRPTTSA